MATVKDMPERPGVPEASENFRQTGARKLEARPGEPAGLPADFGESTADLEKRSSHLMEPADATGEKTRQSEGENPPGSFGTEADPRSEATEGSPDTASPSEARRPS